MSYEKCNRQANRMYKNMSKSVLLDTKKAIKRMIKHAERNTLLTPNVKISVIKTYQKMIENLKY